MKLSGKLCAVCKSPLSGTITQDYWGNVFCYQHIRQLPQCTSCGRLICQHLTEGGFHYPDGLIMCSLCDRRGIFSLPRAEELLKEMRLELKKNGLDLGQAKTPMRLVDRNELLQRSRRSSNEGHILLGLTRGMLTTVKDKVVKQRFMEIIIQKGLPAEQFKLVAIHELCHAWIFYRGIHRLPLKIEEGVCVLSEYLWLQRQKTPEACFWKMRLVKSPDPVYGDGFRQALKSLEKMPLPRMMRYIQKKRKFPGFWAGLLFT
ncbi:MAG: protein DA1 [Endozoicomonadaceae bacterium]|nr:protein DA1 [Endozoicomonadaceae bacterium]